MKNWWKISTTLIAIAFGERISKTYLLNLSLTVQKCVKPPDFENLVTNSFWSTKFKDEYYLQRETKGKISKWWVLQVSFVITIRNSGCNFSKFPQISECNICLGKPGQFKSYHCVPQSHCCGFPEKSSERRCMRTPYRWVMFLPVWSENLRYKTSEKLPIVLNDSYIFEFQNSNAWLGWMVEYSSKEQQFVDFNFLVKLHGDLEQSLYQLCRTHPE